MTSFLAPSGRAVPPSSMIAPGPHPFEGLWMTFAFDTPLPTRPLHGDASLSKLPRTPLGLL